VNADTCRIGGNIEGKQMDQIYSTGAGWMLDDGAVWFVGYGDSDDMPATVSEMLIFADASANAKAEDYSKALWDVVMVQAHGFRLVSQTSNPKRPGLVWNKPKASTYSKFGGCMYLDSEQHVQWSSLSEYSSGPEAKAWSEKYRAGVPEAGRHDLDAWVAAKTAYDDNRKPGDPLGVGLVQAREAWFDEQIKAIKAKAVTARELTKLSSPACSPQYTMTIPAGTRVDYVDGMPVVGDTSKVIGGNAHDLEHYYIWLDPNEVA
jgi:hypothetical protein